MQMNRLTKAGCNGKASYNSAELLDIINRLSLIEDVLGDNYDLDNIQKLIAADKDGEMLCCEENGSMKPRKCPICNGTGIMSDDFYFAVNGYCSPTEMCGHCQGSGIIWGVED